MNTKINLCDNCKFSIPECEARHVDVEYGDGLGNDNIIKCKFYDVKEKMEGV